MTGRTIDAQEAFRIGLVEYLVLVLIISFFVLRFAFPIEAASKKRECWLLDESGALSGKVQVYHFGWRPLRGTLRLQASGALDLTPAETELEVPPGEVVEVPVRIAAAAGAARGPWRLRAELHDAAPGPGGKTRRSSAAVALIGAP